MRFLIVGTIMLLAAQTGAAQILKLHPADAKAEKRYRKHIVEVDGERVILGEPKAGIEVEGRNIRITAGVQEVEVWIIDSADPRKVPYRLKDGRKVEASRKGSLTVPTADLKRQGAISFFTADQTIHGLAAEYELNLERIADLEAERDGLDKASKPWFDRQRRIVEAHRRLAGWLREHGFEKAASKLDRALSKEERLLREDAVEERSAEALASIKPIEVPEDLVAASARVTGGKERFRGLESKHMRVFFPATMNPEAMTQALHTCERVIEGFRREFVDPWITEDFQDFMPDGRFLSFFFTPDDDAAFENFLPEFLGGDWGKNKERSLTVPIHQYRGLRGFDYNAYIRKQEGQDLEGIMVFVLGTDLANIHFNSGSRTKPNMPWLREGVAYYLCFEFLGRNVVTSIEWREKKYDTEPGEEGVKTVEEGQRAAFNLLALKRGVPFADLVGKVLFNMEDADLAKSWSFFDFLARTEPARVNRLLRSGCTYNGRSTGFLEAWREEIRELFALEGPEDPLRILDDRWKSYATGEQRRERKVRR